MFTKFFRWFFHSFFAYILLFLVVCCLGWLATRNLNFTRVYFDYVDIDGNSGTAKTCESYFGSLRCYNRDSFFVVKRYTRREEKI